MKNRVVSWKVLALAATLALGSGCGLLPWGGSYELDIGAPSSATSGLQSLHVIVSAREHVDEALQSESTYDELLSEANLKKYVSYVQYAPEGTSWKALYTGNQSALVEQSVDEDTIVVEIDSDLVEKSTSEYRVVVLGHFGSAGLQQVTVPHMAIAAEGDQVVEIGAESLSLRDR